MPIYISEKWRGGVYSRYTLTGTEPAFQTHHGQMRLTKLTAQPQCENSEASMRAWLKFDTRWRIKFGGLRERMNKRTRRRAAKIRRERFFPRTQPPVVAAAKLVSRDYRGDEGRKRETRGKKTATTNGGGAREEARKKVTRIPRRRNPAPAIHSSEDIDH